MSNAPEPFAADKYIHGVSAVSDRQRFLGRPPLTAARYRVTALIKPPLPPPPLLLQLHLRLSYKRAPARTKNGRVEHCGVQSPATAGGARVITAQVDRRVQLDVVHYRLRRSGAHHLARVSAHNSPGRQTAPISASRPDLYTSSAR